MAIGYKLFREKDGELYPLFVYANEALPMNVWLSAKSGPRTDSGKVKSKIGELAYRPGWHINDEVPYVVHIYSIHDDKKWLKDGCVWCEVEYKTDVNYQDKADSAGFLNGRFSEGRAYLDYIPVGGYYKFKTSPHMYGKWIISGEMKINRILSDSEVEKLCHDKGLEPLTKYAE